MKRLRNDDGGNDKNTKIRKILSTKVIHKEKKIEYIVLDDEKDFFIDLKGNNIYSKNILIIFRYKDLS